MPEQIPPHIHADLRPDIIKSKLLCVSEYTAPHTDQEDRKQQRHQKINRALPDHIVHNPSGYLRRKHIQSDLQQKAHNREQIGVPIVQNIA